jgi:hypothetical protein
MRACLSVSKHILKLTDISNKLKDLKMPLLESYLVHYNMLSLLAIFDNFKINYNGSDKKWSLAELIAKCIQEEESLMTENKIFVNLISRHLMKNHDHGKFCGKASHHKKGKGKKPYDSPPPPMKEVPK